MNILWMDLETTGLDPNINKILELSMIITDSNLNELEVYSNPIHYKLEDINEMDEWCFKTHTVSGLLNDVKNSKITINKIEFDLLNLIDIYFKDCKPLLSGNSIHFDRSFIKRYLPNLNKKLHYRMLDVSSTYEQFRILANIEVPKPEGKHRGISDIRDSINLCKELFKYVVRS